MFDVFSIYGASMDAPAVWQICGVVVVTYYPDVPEKAVGQFPDGSGRASDVRATSLCTASLSYTSANNAGP